MKPTCCCFRASESTVICFRKLSTSKWEKSVKQTKMGRRKKALREWGSAKMRRRIITSKINSNWILMSGALKTQFQGKLQYSSNHYTPLLNEMTSSVTRESPWLQAQVAPLVNADTDHEASRWLDGEGECFKKGVVMEEVSSCPRQEKCKTDEPSKQQEQARSGNSDEEFQVEIMPSSKTFFEVPRLPRRL